MASFITTANLTTAQTLGTSESGIVTSGFGVYVSVGTAITMANYADLAVFGAVVGQNGAAVTLTNVTGAQIAVGTGGSVFAMSGYAAISASTALSGSLAIQNAGTVTGSAALSLALGNSSSLTLSNSGVMSGSGTNAAYALNLGLGTGGDVQIDNTGKISVSGSGHAINAMGSGILNISNSGIISAATTTDSAIYCLDKLDLLNTGTVLGSISASGASRIVNSGTILGEVNFGNTNDSMRVSGLVDGNIWMGNGANVFRIAGGTINGTVGGGTGNDTYYVDQSDLEVYDTGGSNDYMRVTCDYRVVQGIESTEIFGAIGRKVTGSQYAETIWGGSGDDTILGNENADSLTGGYGDDLINGGDGNDSLNGSQGDDQLRGGVGDDLLYASFGADTINGGLGNDILTLSSVFNLPQNTVNLATGKAIIHAEDVITLIGIEKVIGSSLIDLVTGNSQANWFWGGAGNDSLVGGGGNDTLIGADGADVLQGDAGADTFLYETMAQSNATYGIDQIKGFALVGDVIDLSLIDAFAGGADDAFAFIGEAEFTGAGGEVRIIRDALANTTTIEVQRGNSEAIDMTIVLNADLALTAGHFLL